MRIVIFTLIAMSLTLTAFGQDDYIKSIMEKRAETDSVFSDTSGSILPRAEIEYFNGLNYYPVDVEYKIEAKFTKKIGKPFEMQTSTSRKPMYRQYGYVKFTLNGEKCKLNLYQQIIAMEDHEPANEYLFCPFRDLTNKDSTYGGGRYLDFKLADVTGKQTIVIDFNTCYNPYCAYSYRYSCPVPPKENGLKVKIEAGVKKWHE